MQVEVAYSPSADRIERVVVELPEGAALVDALHASGLMTRHVIDVAGASVGVWGRLRPLDTVLRANDRVEIYRGLKVDPKTARRLRQQRDEAGPPAVRRS